MSTDPEFAGYPGAGKFKPWQDHEWPFHCSAPARYIGEIGVREIEAFSAGAVEEWLLIHDVHNGNPPIAPHIIPPRAPTEGENWSPTLHHFRCEQCGWDLILWDAD